MNILSISSILPIPGIFKHNDFVFQTYRYYNQKYEHDRVVIIKPIKIDFNILRLIRKETRLMKLNQGLSLNIDNYEVEILPFLSSWSLRNIHALITHSVFFLNKSKIKALFAAYNFKVIHAQYIFPDGLLAYMLHRKYKIPYFLTTHNERFYFNHRISGRIGKKIMKNASKVLAINYSNFSYFKSIGINNIEILPLGYNNAFIRDQKMSNVDCVKIFTVAELIKLKNIDKVIEALSIIPENLNYHYTIIGTGKEKETLEKMVESLNMQNNVTFLDHVPHGKIADEMYKHDIFIMPSYFETFGRVYFEAMAMGIPIICARNSGISGLFKEREEGISVNHTNVKEIAGALEYLLTNKDERLRIGKNGQDLVKNFTWENLVNILHTKYLEAVDRTE